MTAYDVRARATAGRMLATIANGGKGQAVTLSHPTAATRDADTGILTPGTPVTQTGSGVQDSYKAREIDGTLILAGDRKFILSPFNSAGGVLTAPVAGDTITYGGATWRIQSVEPMAPAGLAIQFTLQLRGV